MSENLKISRKEKEQDKQLEQLFRTALEKQRIQGIKIGLLTASKVVMEKLNDTSKTLMQRINEVKKFCNVSMKDETGFLSDSSEPDTIKTDGSTPTEGKDDE